jgi:hypothetical protein
MSFEAFYFTVGILWALYHTGREWEKHSGPSPDDGWEAFLVLFFWPIVVVVLFLDWMHGTNKED